MKPHLLGAVGGALLVATSLAAPAVAAPSGGCPNATWQTSVFPLDWQPGDPMDPSGENLLLPLGIAGSIEEFGSLDAALAAFGFGTLEDFYAAVVDPGFRKIDHNGDGVLCFKPFSANGNKPAYLANTVDNTSHSQQ